MAGVDFSGAHLAGRKIWVALGTPTGGALRLTEVRRAEELPGGAAGRAPALSALVAWLAGLGPCAVGLDFPFGLHRSLVPERTLAAFVRGFAARHPDPQTFREACLAAGGERALKRQCDLEARTPFAPHNLRLYRQTWHGIAEVLAPLCRDGARLLPQQAPAPGALWLLEACPASALKARDWYAPYKGRGPDHRRARGALLRRLHDEGVAIPRTLVTAARNDADGDALDAVLCAWIAWRAVRDPAALRPPLTPAHRLEGYVYA